LLQAIANASGFCVNMICNFPSDGLSIYSQYKFGSKRDGNERIGISSVELMGLLIEDVDYIINEIPENVQGTHLTSTKQLSKRDVKKLKTMMDSVYAEKSDVIATQCRRMLELNMKCEIETLHSISMDYLINGYITDKLKAYGILDMNTDYTTWTKSVQNQQYINDISGITNTMAYEAIDDDDDLIKSDFADEYMLDTDVHDHELPQTSSPRISTNAAHDSETCYGNSNAVANGNDNGKVSTPWWE
jgi:hypothetical protein